MPIFEYSCLKCNNVFEIMHIGKEPDKMLCSKCGSDDIKKILSSFATHESSSHGLDYCNPESCGMPSGEGGMPPCAGGGCGMM